MPVEYLTLPYLTTGLVCLLGGVVSSWRSGQPRKPAALAAAIAFVSFLGAAREVIAVGHGRLFDPLLPCFDADALDAVPMAFYAALTLMVVELAPKRDAGHRAMAGMLIISLATQIAYAAAGWTTLLSGWWLSCLPFVLGMFGVQHSTKLAIGLLLASCLALTAAVAVMHAETVGNLSHGGSLTFGLIILAVMCRKGVFPLHSGVVQAFEKGPLLPVALLFNGHLGVLLVAHSEASVLPQSARQAFDILSVLAVVSACIISIRAFAETKPRRLLAFLYVSQASFILAGIAAANIAGITGALVHWLALSAASTGLICIVRVLEVRVSSSENPLVHLGLAVKAPRLATFFLICGLALIGLPGTLSYCGEELIFHGTLANHPAVGITLLVTSAFNAINLIRLYGILFLGVLPKHVIDIPDALPRERWPLTACVVFLVLGGLFPGIIIGWRAETVQAIEKALGVAAAAMPQR